MYFNSAKHLNFYYIITLSLLVSVLLFGVFNYVPLSSEKLLLNLESAVEMEKLEKESSVDKISALVMEDRLFESVKLLEDISQKTSKINEYIPTEEYKELSNESEEMKKLLLEAATMPDFSSIIPVLKGEN